MIERHHHCCAACKRSMVLARVRTRISTEVAELLTRDRTELPPSGVWYLVRFLSDDNTGYVEDESLLAVWEEEEPAP